MAWEIITTVGSWLSAIVGFGSLGVPGWIAAGIFALVVAGGGFWLSRKTRQLKLDEANRKTDQGRAHDLANIANKGRETESDGKAAADALRKAVDDLKAGPK